MSWLEALILGVVQGLTEFLPVSSSGHLEIGSVLLGLQVEDNLLFAITVHLATALATLSVFRKDIGSLCLGLFEFKMNDSWRFAGLILISMIPVGVIGVLWKDQVEAFFTGNMMLVGSMLLVTSLLLVLSHFAPNGDRSVNPIKAFLIGLAQAIAILPGISRSGATISTALLLGVAREKAARFSFLMVIIPILGASVLQFKDYMETSNATSIEISSLVVGFIASYITGYLACTWMVKLVTQGKLIFFAVYCALVGIAAIISLYL